MFFITAVRRLRPLLNIFRYGYLSFIYLPPGIAVDNHAHRLILAHTTQYRLIADAGNSCMVIPTVRGRTNSLLHDSTTWMVSGTPQPSIEIVIYPLLFPVHEPQRVQRHGLSQKL